MVKPHNTMNLSRTRCFHLRHLVARVICLLFVASIRIAFCEPKVALLSDDQLELGSRIIALIRECEDDPRLGHAKPEAYSDHEYWSRVFELGNSVTAGQEEKLIAETDRSLTDTLGLIARAAATRRGKLDDLVQRYKVEFVQDPIRRGANRVPLRAEDCTGEMTLLWEALLLSPRIGALGSLRCAEALRRCGTIHSLPVIHHARHRLIAGRDSPARVSLRDDIRWLSSPAGSALDNWINLIVKIDEGGKHGVYWLLRALEVVEEEYPEISSLEKYAESSIYTRRSPGVSVYIMKSVFPKRSKDGNSFVWQNAFETIATDKLSDRGRKVVQQVRQEVFGE